MYLNPNTFIKWWTNKQDTILDHLSPTGPFLIEKHHGAPKKPGGCKQTPGYAAKLKYLATAVCRSIATASFSCQQIDIDIENPFSLGTKKQ